jgi:hypothetical protein
VLADFGVKDKELPEWVSKIAEGLSSKQLKRELKKASGAKTGGKTRQYLKKEKNGFRMYPFSITKDDPEKDKVIKILQDAIEVLKG